MAFGIDDIIGAGLRIIEKVIPDPQAKAEAQLKMLQLAQQGEFKQLEADLQMAQGQMDINKIEAANPNTFVSGARPFLMWTGGVGLALQWVVMPFVSFMYILSTGHDIPVHLPPMDPNVLILIGSLLGIHIGVRSYEKVKGVA
jgi:hypothetical protein